MPLVAQLVPEFLLPSLFRVSYTPDELVLLVILLTGTAVGATRRFPTWSYTWVVLTLVSIVAFLTSALLSLFFLTDLRAFAFGWLVTLLHLAGGLLVVVFAASRANRGLTHTFFIAAVYLVSITLRTFLLGWSPDLYPVAVIAANSFIIFITALELVVVLAAVAHFLAGDARIQRRSVYVMIAVALLDPLLAGWALAIGSAGTGNIVNATGVFVGLPVLARWVHIGVTLLLTWMLIPLFIRTPKERMSSGATRGEADG